MQCTHVKADGIRCGSPALRGEAFCYFHFYNADHRPRRDAKAVDIPFPEDAQCVQVGLYNVMRAVIERKIDDKRARLLIWSLQVAASQARTLRFDSCIHQSQLVTELPEYERVQRDTAKADREYVANVRGEDPTLAARTWGTQTGSDAEGDTAIAPSPAGKGAAPTAVDGAECAGKGAAPEAHEDAAEGETGPAGEGTGATSEASTKQEGGGGDSVDDDKGGTGHSPVPTHKPVPTQEGEAAEAADTRDAAARVGASAITREQMESLIARAVNDDWRNAQTLFREAGLMPSS